MRSKASAMKRYMSQINTAMKSIVGNRIAVEGASQSRSCDKLRYDSENEAFISTGCSGL